MSKRQQSGGHFGGILPHSNTQLLSVPGFISPISHLYLGKHVTETSPYHWSNQYNIAPPPRTRFQCICFNFVINLTLSRIGICPKSLVGSYCYRLLETSFVHMCICFASFVSGKISQEYN